VLPEKVVYEEVIFKLDKTSLAAGDNLTLNEDGTPKSLEFANGGFNVTAINTVNDGGYT